MTNREQIQREIDTNLVFFETKLQDLLRHHRDRYVLLREASIAGIYDTIRDAQTAASSLFADGKFSVQKVTDRPVQLGVYSYAMHLGTAQ